MKDNITETRSFTRTIELTGKDIVDLLRTRNPAIARNAEATTVFQVPGGGDWSNCTIPVDETAPVIVTITWEKK